MRLLSVGFLLGIYVLQLLSSLPPKSWSAGLLLSPFFVTLFWKYRLVIGFSSGFLYALWIASIAIETRITPELEGQDLIVSGHISSIPHRQENGWRFRLNVDQSFLLADPSQEIDFKGTIRLGWYRTEQVLRAGERWQMVVRLKQPSGFMNPGGFDYEKWLFQEGISATGYIRKSDKNTLLEPSSRYSINPIRENILHTIRQQIDKPELAAIVGALAVADRSAISDDQWKVLRQTGTNHLVAISGLHIGMVAGFGFFPIILVWWLFPTLYLKVPVRVAGAMVGAIFAISYALLAGLTLPTQRALIMVLVVLFGLLARRQYSGSSILAVALFAVLVYDPLAVLSQGFWLSFVAVALILWTSARRIQRQRFDIFTIQFSLSLGMLPLTLGLFGVSSLSAPLANLLAIPWVTVVVVPLTLLGVLMMPFETLSYGLLNLAAYSVSGMMAGLSILSSSETLLSIPEIPMYLLLISLIGFLWLWLPAKFPARWLGLVLMSPLIVYHPVAIEEGHFDYHLLDVGQGLASVVQTKNHVLIYDTGPRSSARFDTGKLVVLPFLRAKGIDQVDMMMISHGDNDHSGGAGVIREQITIDKILSSDTRLFSNVKSCTTGMKWAWDGVQFEVLHPEPDWQGNDNNRSCVLRISNQFHRLLLTGDIQKKAEKKLLESGLNLVSEVMTMPHHGSKTSSTDSLIDAVQPELALITTGYRNKFHLPNKQVLKRYESRGIKMIDTMEKGAISIRFENNKKPYERKSYRDVYKRYWHSERRSN